MNTRSITLKFAFFAALFIFISGFKIITQPKPVLEGEEYLAFAESMPEPDGGIQAIYAKIKYPKVAKEAKLQGKVFVLVFVNTSGAVDDVKVVKGLGGGCDEEVMTAVKSTKFTPGKNKGQAVKVKLALAFEFKL
jgi:periplasmic protein TonB